MRRAGLLITIMIALLTLGRDVCAQKPTESSEYEIKAGFIYKFANFVELPGSTFPSVDSPIVIGVLGDDSFAAQLGEVVKGKKLNGRGFVVRKVRWNSKDARELKDCNMLYIAAGEQSSGDEIIAVMRGAPTLTIADFLGFAKHGGIINFVLQDNKVRFQLNLEAAKQSDLKFSAPLLGVATIVTTEPNGR